MANAKATKTSFKKGNKTAGRGKSERTKILDAMERAGETEEGFYDLLVTKATDPKDKFTFRELLIRISPIPKQTSPLVEFEFDEKAKPHIQAGQVLKAISQQLIPADVGNMFIQSVKAMIDIEEYTDLKDRIDKLEKALNGQS